MKKISVLAAFVITFFAYANAQKNVALHSNGTTTIFAGDTPLTDAYNASASGDTLYVSGGNFTAPNEIKKGLVIIGAGYDIDSTSVTQPTVLSGAIGVMENADSLYLEGMEFLGELSFHRQTLGVTIIRCKLSNGLTLHNNNSKDNWAIAQCIVKARMNLNKLNNSVISNCIIQTKLSSSTNNVLNNNIFTFGYLNNPPFVYVVSNTFTNNIFTSDTGPVGAGSSSNTFKYNIFVTASPSLGASPTDLNNYKEVDLANVFVNSQEGDYHLQSTAVPTYKGDDDTEVGIYGGMLPFKEGAVPGNPHISMKIIPSTTNTNGFLQISFKVNAQQ